MALEEKEKVNSCTQIGILKVTVSSFRLILFPTLEHIWCVMLYLQAVSTTHSIAMERKKHKMQDFDLQSYLICLCSKAVVRAPELKGLLKKCKWPSVQLQSQA